MAENNIIMFLLILVALGAAWYLGYRRKIKKKKQQTSFKDDYFVGLNYLLNDEPDDAVDVFINALEVNSNTLATHMALGTLLRRRGKVDRSISVYQDLLGRPYLSEDELNQIKIELVKSYVAGGLLDRAERLLDELKLVASVKIRVEALMQAVTVYQLEKDWEKAVESIIGLLLICPLSKREQYQHQASHYYCEIAAIEQKHKDHPKAKVYLKQAQQMDKKNVRVNLMLGEIEFELKRYKDAIKSYQKVEQQDGQFSSVSFLPLLKCYQEQGLKKQTQKFIQTSINKYLSPVILLEIATTLEKQSGVAVANEFVLEQLRKNPSLIMLNKAIGLINDDSEAKLHTELNLFHEIMSTYLSKKPGYKCTSCGFELKSLNWLCPSCATWGNVKPVNSDIIE